MSKTQIVGLAAVITSAVTMEELKKLQKYQPESLKLVERQEDGTKKEKFAISTGETLSVNKYGIQFNSVTTNGKASVTVPIPAYTEDKVAWVKENLGVAILNLNVMEDQIENALLNLAEHFQAVEENIEVIE